MFRQDCASTATVLARLICAVAPEHTLFAYMLSPVFACCGSCIFRSDESSASVKLKEIPSSQAVSAADLEAQWQKEEEEKRLEEERKREEEEKARKEEEERIVGFLQSVVVEKHFEIFSTR